MTKIVELAEKDVLKSYCKNAPYIKEGRRKLRMNRRLKDINEEP